VYELRGKCEKGKKKGLPPQIFAGKIIKKINKFIV